MPDFTTDDGVRLHYETRGQGPLLLCLHGMGGDALVWEPVWAALGTEPLQRVALDFRGHGRSERNPSAFTIERLAHDVLGLADALGAKRFALLGLSFGGKVALQVAALAPSRVRGLVLAGSVGPGPVALARDAVEPLLARFGDVDFLRELFRSWHVVWPSPDIERWLHAFAATAGWAHRAVCESALWTDLSAQIGRLGTPTLLIAGAHDPVYGPEFQQSAVRPSVPRADLTTLNCGHGLILERPAEIAALTGDFLRRVDSAADA